MTANLSSGSWGRGARAWSASADEAAGAGGAQVAAITALVVIGLFALCAVSVARGWYYDDEITNIQLYSPSYGALIHTINTTDVHPPGSYVLNKVLFDLTGSWKAVQVFGGAFVSMGSGLLFWLVAPRLPRRSVWALGALLATGATVAMWGASLRWYSYFCALYLPAVGVALSTRLRFDVAAIALAVLTCGLFYLGYIAVLLMPPLWLALAWRLSGQSRAEVIRGLAILAVLALLTVAAIAPQLAIFLHASSHLAGSQRSALPASLAGVTYTVLMGNAVLPQTPPAIAGAVGFMILAALALRSERKAFLVMVLAITIFSAMAIGLAGLGGKVRNAVFLLPLASIVYAIGFSSAPRWLACVGLLLAAVLQLTSVVHVALHDDTSKGSFNKPYGEVLNRIAARSSSCPAGRWVFATDIVLSYGLQKAGYSVSSPATSASPGAIQLKTQDCVSVVTSDASNMTAADFQRYESFNAPELIQRSQAEIGVDRSAQFKSKLGFNRPSHFFRLKEYVVSAPTSVQFWTTPAGPTVSP